jgi:hypothetical protein
MCLASIKYEGFSAAGSLPSLHIQVIFGQPSANVTLPLPSVQFHGCCQLYQHLGCYRRVKQNFSAKVISQSFHFWRRKIKEWPRSAVWGEKGEKMSFSLPTILSQNFPGSQVHTGSGNCPECEQEEMDGSTG